jgi:hypothetical protein
MKIMDYIFCLDLFGQTPKLLINQKAQMRTYFGLFISLLTYTLFILIFLYELQEVIYKQNPNVITNKFNSQFYNSSITFNENTFKLIIAQDNDELSKYFKLQGTLLLRYRGKKGKYILIDKKLSFTECKPEEIDNDYKQYFKERLPNNVKALCPRGLYSKEFENITNFTYFINIDLRECRPSEEDCTYNKTIYDDIRRGDYSIKKYYSLFKSQVLNVFDNSKPFYPNIQTSTLNLSNYTYSTTYSLEVNELITNDNYILNHSGKESHFRFKGKEYEANPTSFDVSSRITFIINGEAIRVTVRNYKGLLTALAHSLSLIRLALYVIKILVKYHIKYSIEEVIIGKNFYLDTDETHSENKDDRKVSTFKQNLVEKMSNIKLIETNIKKTTNQGRLTMRSIYLNVSCCRYFLCRRQNKTLLFYNEVKKIINKYLSAENLLYCLIGVKRLRSLRTEERATEAFDLRTMGEGETAYKISYDDNDSYSINERLDDNKLSKLINK